MADPPKGANMSEFKRYHSYESFAQEVKNHSRYVRSQESEEFLNAVKASVKKRVNQVKSGEKYWRAQLGHDIETIVEINPHGCGDIAEDRPCPYSPDRMKPLLDCASEGRANPKGIPYLYLATKKNTAMAEIRPWVGSMISVAIFEITKEIRIVDCSTDFNCTYGCCPTTEEREKAIWADINKAFSIPIIPNDRTADYVPTQIIAELINYEGYYGIKYQSTLGDGKNFVLFDIDIAALKSTHLFKAKAIDFDFQPISCTR